ncbi:MAG: hypothetical protein AVDCRST_MAG59-2572 [uncultured Thermomicrobiales bacterium]|uniref:DUF7482 domain-containing protein n=1 Tax=uncultured Thermomicrobiales bacterium TaxID=1645740 RepID=A0A6J4UX60_9BACT|nr:MAG: hypothetical protein AVDCRST_MAG59-2572 [uncultured Thermomicrobiales bacterium]
MRETLLLDRGIDRRKLLLGIGAGAGLAVARQGQPTLARQATPRTEEAEAIVGDVVDFTLAPEGRWPGPFSSVTLRLHPGVFDGGDVWFIRTDASDPGFAEQEGLVYVPLLRNALEAEGSFAALYRVADGVDGQRPVLSATPAQEGYSPAFRLHDVAFAGEPELLDSVAAIEEAAAAGRVTVTPLDIVVNHPLVIWPGGGLAIDPDLEMPLGAGPLVEEPDLAAGTVTFKLHQCYPGSRYIATDTSAAPMAPMMGVVGSAPTQALIEANATAPIYVFGNGLAGPGPMGFQPSIFNSKAGDVIWSPFWEHFTATWTDPAKARLLTSEAELMAAVEAGELELFNGTPDTHPDGFVVNCPAPVLAPNGYDPARFAAGTPTA